MDLQAVGMLFKRGSTISAAEGGCQAEVGGEGNILRSRWWAVLTRVPTVACSMAAAGFAACMGAPPETVLQVSSPKRSRRRSHPRPTPPGSGDRDRTQPRADVRSDRWTGSSSMHCESRTRTVAPLSLCPRG